MQIIIKHSEIKIRKKRPPRTKVFKNKKLYSRKQKYSKDIIDAPYKMYGVFVVYGKPRARRWVQLSL